MVHGLKNYYRISTPWETTHVGEYLFKNNIPTTMGAKSMDEANYLEYFTELTDEDVLFIKITFPDVVISKVKDKYIYLS
jgi:hypothetical protein